MEAKAKMTQRDIILWHLQNVGTLTRAQAMGEYGIIEPERCEKCDYCKQTKILTKARKTTEFYF